MIAECEGYGGMLGHHDDRGVFRELSADLAAQGVIFTDLDSAVRECPDLIERYFMAEAVKPEFQQVHRPARGSVRHRHRAIRPTGRPGYCAIVGLSLD